MDSEKRYKGVRRRSWGKWVSEIRVPASRERLWLGSYATPEAAAVAHDTAVFLLRGPSSSSGLNFPGRVPAMAWSGGVMSPRSVQRVASDSGLAIDAQLVSQMPKVEQRASPSPEGRRFEDATWGQYGGSGEFGGQGELDISIDDMEIYL